MSRISFFAIEALRQALADGGIEKALLSSGRLGCIIGSTMGGSQSLNEAFEIILPNKDLSLMPAMKFFQCVSHTAALNAAQYLGITGCVMATSAACASALQAIGTGYDLIRLGRQDVVLCGGAEELHPTVAGSFDILFATSAGFNSDPTRTPRPFDSKRDGLVCGEGSAIVLLEEYDRALRRNAKIYGEIIGYHTSGSGNHISHSNKDAMASCMREAMGYAGVGREEVDYINAHATGTIQGDRAEAEAIAEIFGDSTPVSSLKGYFGHTLGASGALELIVSLAMMEKGRIYPTRNLDTIAPDCGGIGHVTKTLPRDISIILKNCFAFGGINSALVCKKVGDR